MISERCRRGGGLLSVMAVVLVAAAPAQASQAGPVPVLVVDGRGFGHGVGMAQEGAYAMGLAGATTPQILGQFYPGTTVGQASGQVRVPVLTSATGAAWLSFPSGGEIRSALRGAQAPGFPIAVGPGESVTLRYDGSFRASVTPVGTVVAQEASGATIVEPPVVTDQQPSPPPAEAPSEPLGPTPAVPPMAVPPLTPVPAIAPPAPVPALPPPNPPTAATPPPAAPASVPGPAQAPEPVASPAPEAPPSDQGNDGPEVSSPSALFAVPAPGSTVALPARSARYRGLVEITAAGGGLRLVNRLDVEDYLRGMGEVRDPSWPAAALGAQAVAARTYALRAMATGNEICATQRCQVYLGQHAEYAAMDAAVAATRGQVLVYGNELATAVYSANGGGVSATPKEGFGPAGTDLPYLRSAAYPTGDRAPWQVKVSLSDLAARLGYPSTLQSVRVSATGPSGRATAVELSGGAGVRTLAARTFAQALGLRSTLWSLSLGSAESTPPPPTPADLVQVPPSEASVAIPDLAAVPAVPPAADDRVLDQPTPIATTGGPTGTGSSANPGGPLWELYAVIFVATASRRRLRGLWSR